MKKIIIPLIAFTLLTGAMPHDMNDPRHWYEEDCCDTQDCDSLSHWNKKLEEQGKPHRYKVIRNPDGSYDIMIGDIVYQKNLRPLIDKSGRNIGDVRISQDDQYHLCIHETQGFMCLYAYPIDAF